MIVSLQSIHTVVVITNVLKFDHFSRQFGAPTFLIECLKERSASFQSLFVLKTGLFFCKMAKIYFI